jgi:ribonucleoside-diphosphate reductase alpha chain
MIPIPPPKRERLPHDRRSLSGELVIAPGSPEEVCVVVTLGYYPDGRLGEIFVRQEKEGGAIGALLDAVATVASISLQYGVPWEVLAEKMAHQRFPPSGLTMDKDHDLKIVASLLDYLARWVTKRQRIDTHEIR